MRESPVLTRLNDIQKALAFYAVAFGACMAVTLLAPFFGERNPVVAMFTPLVAVLLMLLVLTREDYRAEGWLALGVHRAGLRAWGVSFAVPLLASRSPRSRSRRRGSIAACRGRSPAATNFVVVVDAASRTRTGT